jgi:60 kDa SS-A/Ro ribonucleoprotein
MTGEIPDVPFQMLTALPLTDQHWKQIAKNATWNQVRMNINTFQRHNVFSEPTLLKALCDKLQDPEQVKSAKVFPYQLYTAFLNIDANVSNKVSVALQNAADHALQNIPEFRGKVYVMVDTSGSMSSPVTGYRGSVTTKMRCIDAAALIASAILRKNPDAKIIPFDTSVHAHRFNPFDSIMTNAKTLAGFGGGDTNCSEALAHVNRNGGRGDLVIYVSDNESFMDSQHYRQTATMEEWDLFKKKNPNAKLVNIDIQPYSTTQTHERSDILNIGGFNDSIFEVIAKFVEFGNDKEMWVSTVEAVAL